jgi:large subunit ribosomal protein L1
MGKRYDEARSKVDRDRKYSLAEAVSLAREVSFAKFDETVEVAVRLGVDPKHADQMVRGAVVLPHGTGREVRVLVFAKGDKEREAKQAGADHVGSDDLIKRITEGWLEFDKIIATPDMMGAVGRIGKILGPRGLMPSPKVGTVTFEVEKAVKELKAGKVEYRVDKVGNVHVAVGKRSFDADKLAENLLALLDSIVKAKPAASKGTYLKGIALATSMGPGIRIDPLSAVAALKG